MSLKNFHLVFIFLAILCCLSFAAWTQWGAASEVLTPSLQGAGLFSGVGGVFLIFYGIRFYRKSRSIIV